MLNFDVAGFLEKRIRDFNDGSCPSRCARFLLAYYGIFIRQTSAPTVDSLKLPQVSGLLMVGLGMAAVRSVCTRYGGLPTLFDVGLPEELLHRVGMGSAYISSQRSCVLQQYVGVTPIVQPDKELVQSSGIFFERSRHLWR